VAKLRTLLLTVVAGFLVLAGILSLAVAWFGLRDGQTWALVTLSVADGLALAFWWLALKPYFSLRPAIGISDLPPFIWIPTALIIPAIVLGTIGLRIALTST